LTAKDHTGPLLRVALESFLIAGRQTIPAMINKGKTNENNTDVDFKSALAASQDRARMRIDT
jgi:hypothetical protein